MTEQIREAIKLSPEQLEQLREATQNGAGNYPAGYALIHGWIKDNPAAQKDGTVFWFEQAKGINGDDSLSARFIRRHTDNGLDLGGVSHSERMNMQVLSNTIARNVTQDVLKAGAVEPLAEIIHRDISVALDKGKVPLGGWGGSFYYWDMPFKADGDFKFPRDADGTYHTVGEEIIKRGELPLLINASSQTVAEMQRAGELPMKDWGMALKTGFDAGLPLQYQTEIGVRAAAIIGTQEVQELKDDAGKNFHQLEKNLRCFAIPSMPDCPGAGAQLTPPSTVPNGLDKILENPSHPLVLQALQGVEKLPADSFATSQERQNAGAALGAKAAMEGFSHIDQVIENADRTKLLAMQGVQNDPARLRAHIDKADAIIQPMEVSMAQLPSALSNQTELAQAPKKMMMA
jgi:hypothetical protein